MKSVLQFISPFLTEYSQSTMRFMGVMVVAIGLSACSSIPGQETEDDPEASQAVVAKDLAIPPNLINPAIENKQFDDAAKKPTPKTQN